MTVCDGFKKVEYLSCFVGAGSSNIPTKVRIVGATIWFTSLIIHFSYDFYEGKKLYGWTFLVTQTIWFLSLVATTWGTAYKALPWLTDGHKELERDSIYEKTLQKTSKLLHMFPYVLIIFGFIASGIQHSLLHLDKAMHIDFGRNSTEAAKVVLQVIRFSTSFHVYAGSALFWVIPTSIMLMTGYSMAEFMEEMSRKMKDKERVLAFKDAISSYSQRAKFVKTSSSKTFLVLATLMIVGVLCFALNAYNFLFGGKRLYLHVWHSLLPVVLMIYPLCTAAWVTKQYTWFIITVVRAWVHRDDLDDSSDEDCDEDDKKNAPQKIRKKFWESIQSKSMVNEQEDCSPKVSLQSIPDSANLPPWQQKANAKAKKGKHEKTQNAFVTAVNAVNTANKFSKYARHPRFNFEKFLTYLESMRSVVGFHIAGIMVTWDLVSTTLFLLFSVVAVFMQESIFGSQKSTLSD